MELAGVDIPLPAWTVRRIGAEDVVEGENVAVAEVPGRLAVGADDAGVRADLELGKDDADAHVALLRSMRSDRDSDRTNLS